MNKLYKIVPLFFFVFFYGCEQNDDGLELIYSSINDGDILDNYSGGVFLKFSREISNEEFDAVSVDNSSQIDVADTIDVDGSLINDFVEHMYFVESSNYIRLNNQPQTFIYDSNNKYCLLIGITTEYFPDGTGEGFSPNIGSNTLKIGDNEINFTINTTSAISCVPNPYRAVSVFNENEHMRTITFINATNKIIDIYQIDNEAYIKRLINNDEDNSTIRWDLRNFDNEEVLSGIYAYRVGTDTTNGGYLNYFTESYFSIIKPDD